MLGNLALMRILVHEAHMPLLAANSIAILCCSIVNFCLGNNWALRRGVYRRDRSTRRRATERCGREWDTWRAGESSALPFHA
jgi:putative flippase GtrA